MKKIWFGRKIYGWGWVPVTWQGWLVTARYVAFAGFAKTGKMKGYVSNIEKLSLANDNFRKVLYTDKNSQLVLMSLNAGQDIGEEVHDVDQFLRVEQGTGKAILSGVSHDLADGSVIIVPAGTKHNVINSGSGDMKLYTLYMPPHHRDGVIHRIKADAEVDTTDEFDGKTTEQS